MHMREENMLEAVLAGVCARCENAIDFIEEWHLRFCYRSGECPQCGLDHHVCIKKA